MIHLLVKEGAERLENLNSSLHLALHLAVENSFTLTHAHEYI